MSELYNCHTHIFNIKNAPDDFLEGFKGKFVANVAWKMLNTKLGAKILIKLLKRSRKPHNRKLASFLKVGLMKSQNDIFKDLKSNYGPGNKFVVLTLNMDHMSPGTPEHKFNEQIHEIKRVIAQNPDSCLPFYSVDPRAGTGIQLKDKAEKHITKKGFVGIKIYPAMGFYPFDPALEETYQWASENSVPIMTHCTRVGSYYLGKLTMDMKNPASFYNGPLNKWPAQFGSINFPITKYLNKNELFCDYFSEIYNYAIALHKFENLKICFAHAGGVAEIAPKKNGKYTYKVNGWFDQIKHLMETYPNVYTDVSYTLYEKHMFKYLFDLINDPKIGHKVLFGTDYFMTLREAKELRLITEFRKYLEANSQSNNLWEKITVNNPKDYLTSNFYSA